MGFLRIIAGELKGQRIHVPGGPRIRPTAGRVREALFSILGESVADASVLDAYSGSGALAFEALSRGARAAVLIEADRHAARRLRENAARLGLGSRCVVFHGRVLDVLSGASVGGPFDLILADPPYALGELARFLAAASKVLTPLGQIVLERERRGELGELSATALARHRTATYGRTCLDFYRHAR